MSPPPPTSARSLNRQVVLDEDEYTEGLSHIIARDFFPSLVHLDATNSYLDALRTQDHDLIHASERRLQELATPAPRHSLPYQTPSQTPFGAGPSETPHRTPQVEGPNKRQCLNWNLSLDSFQAKYTSEDNSSFTEILDDENRKRKEKWAWAWEAQKRVEQQRDRMVEARERMSLEPPLAVGVREKFRIEMPSTAGMITDKEDSDGKDDEMDSLNRKQIVSTARDEDMTDVMAPKKDKRPAGVDGWKFRARNALMFPPDADVSPYMYPMSDLNTGDSWGDPKSIKHPNTRLPEQDDAPRHSSAPPSPTQSRINAAIAGTPYRPRSPTHSSFTLLPALPSPTPSELGPAAVKQLMTWGTLNATPRILSQPDDPADPSTDLPLPNAPFHLPGPSSREIISRKLSTNASKSLRARATLLGSSATARNSGIYRTPGSTKKGSMAPPSWTPRKADSAGLLTPAARRLLDRTTMSAAGSKRAEAMGRTAGWEGQTAGKEKNLNRVRWTPTPSPVARRGL